MNSIKIFLNIWNNAIIWDGYYVMLVYTKRGFIMNRKKRIIPTFLLICIITIIPLIIHSESNNHIHLKEYGPSVIPEIKSIEQINTIVEKSGKNLIMLDLYADWCQPCKILSPMLEKIAAEYIDKVSVYKINIDNNPDIARAFMVSGIPYVVFVKDKKVVYTITGLRSKGEYIDTINRLNNSDS
jgi:thioredoxin 1